MIRVPFLLLLLLLCTGLLPAQSSFVQIDGPPVGDPTHLVTAPDGTLFLFSNDHERLLRSADGGKSWEILRGDLPSGEAAALHAAADGTIYLVMYSGTSGQVLFRSVDNGASWERLAVPSGRFQRFPLLSSDRDGGIYLLMSSDVPEGKAYRSANRGTTWTPFAGALGALRSLARMDDGTFLAVPGTYEGGTEIYRSTDDGATWSRAAGVADESRELFKDILAGPGGRVWAMSDNGDRGRPYYSEDNGITWRQAPALPASYAQGSFVMRDGRLLAGAKPGPRVICRYSWNGSQWKIDTLSSHKNAVYHPNIPITVTSDGAIMTSFGESVVLSRDDGATWEPTGLSDGRLTCMAVGSQDRLYIGVRNGGVMRSRDGAKSWTLASAGMGGNYDVNEIVADRTGTLLAITDGRTRMYRSENGGDSWSAAGPDGMTAIATAFIARNGDMYLSARAGFLDDPMKLFRSVDRGKTWDLLPSHPDSATTIGSMAESADGALYLLASSGLYRSGDLGREWTSLKPLAPGSAEPSLLICSNGDILLADGTSLHRSTDGGTSWSKSDPIFDDSFIFQGGRFLGMAPGGQIWLSTMYDGFQISHDNGLTWNLGAPMSFGQHIAFTTSGDIYIIVDGWQLYRGRDISPWSMTSTSSGDQVLALGALTNGSVLASTLDYGLAISPSNGEEWVRAGISGAKAHSFMAGSKDTIWAGTDIGVFRRINGGSGWTHVSGDIPSSLFIFGLVRDAAGTIYAGTFGGGVYASSNEGGGWTARNTGLGNLSVKGLSLGSDGSLFAATNGGVYGTADGGMTWRSANGDLPNGFYANVVLYREGRYLLAANKGGIYRSADKGEHWEQADMAVEPSAEIRALYADQDGRVWAGCNAGIFFSNDDGRTWQFAGLGGQSVRAITANSGYIFAGTTTNGIYRIARGMASAGGGEWEKAAAASLQAMPNPSSGGVRIRFVLPESGHAMLDLYDMRGTRVASLLDADLAAGEHMAGYAGDLPAGAYYCVLTHRGVRTMLEVLLLGREGR